MVTLREKCSNQGALKSQERWEIPIEQRLSLAMSNEEVTKEHGLNGGNLEEVESTDEEVEVMAGG